MSDLELFSVADVQALAMRRKMGVGSRVRLRGGSLGVIVGSVPVGPGELPWWLVKLDRDIVRVQGTMLLLVS